MAIETAAQIVILGAGPIGLEAALYARNLGYDVRVYERGRIAENVRRWGHVRLFSPFGLNRSALGLAALEAWDANYQPAADDALLTGRQWVKQYLEPLSQTGLLAGRVRLGTTVVSVGRDSALKGELVGKPARGEQRFRLLLRDARGQEQLVMANVVIDTTGVYGNPNWLGRGGIPAVGESKLRDRIEFGLPDVAGAQRHHYADRHTLVIGAGYSAATTVTSLATLAREHSQTRVTWITRREPSEDGGPIRRIPHDRLPERDRLADAANDCARDASANVAHLSATAVQSVAWNDKDGQFDVQLSGRHEGRYRFDRIVANVGYRPDSRLYEELQVHQCYASDGPMKLAAALLGGSSSDCLDQPSHGAATLQTPEPNFYILGAKSYGRRADFLVHVGLQQIRELFTIITGRSDLDLYAGAGKLPSDPAPLS